MRLCRLAQRALDSVSSALRETMGTVLVFEDRVGRRPVSTCRQLTRNTRRLVTAALRVTRAQELLAEARKALERVPEHLRGDAEIVLDLADERARAAVRWMHYVVGEVVLRQVEVLAGLASGELVPEHPSDSRPRAIVKPRPLAVRAFLTSRLHRVADRITPTLRRRRRTPRPAALTVPPPTSQGRAPPFSSTCAF